MSDNALLEDQRLVQFSRREKRGIVLGLDASQLGFAAVTVVVVLVNTFIGGFPGGFFTGVLMAIPFGAIAWIRFGGDSLPTWMRRALSHVLASAQGQNEYRHKPLAPSQATRRADRRNADQARKSTKSERFKPVKPIRMMLPGEAGELLCYQMESGTALVHDPIRRTVTFCAQVAADAFDLLDTDEQDMRVQVWSQLLVGFASHPGVLRIQTLDRTVVHPSADILDYYTEQSTANGAGAKLNPLADASYRDLISKASTHTRHDMYLVVVLSVEQLRREVRGLGGGIGALMELVHTEMDAISVDMPLAGVRIDSWLEPRALAGVIREAFDPDAIEELGERTGDRVGVSVESGGPMAATRTWDTLRTDTAFHRTYWISEWPRVNVAPGFISSLTFAGDFIHSVSVVAEPIDSGSALKRIERDLQDVAANRRLQDKLGQTRTLQQDQERVDVELREEELVAGHGEVRFSGFVTISAPTKETLAAADAKLRHGASQARVELRVLYGQQHQGFLVGALPLGRGVKK